MIKSLQTFCKTILAVSWFHDRRSAFLNFNNECTKLLKYDEGCKTLSSEKILDDIRNKMENLPTCQKSIVHQGKNTYISESVR